MRKKPNLHRKGKNEKNEEHTLVVKSRRNKRMFSEIQNLIAFERFGFSGANV